MATRTSTTVKIVFLTWFCKYYEQHNTETALIKAEAAKIRKVKEAKKRKALNTISIELAKRSVDKDI